MKKSKKAIIIVCIAFVLVFAIGITAVKNIVNRANNLLIQTPALSEIADGKYIGEYSVLPVSVKVEVTVERYQITDVDILRHENGLGSPAERVIDDVIQNQSLDVDAISGATVSSKCILKAIENALNGESDYE